MNQDLRMLLIDAGDLLKYRLLPLAVLIAAFVLLLRWWRGGARSRQ